MALARLKEAAEIAKIELTANTTTTSRCVHRRQGRCAAASSTWISTRVACERQVAPGDRALPRPGRTGVGRRPTSPRRTSTASCSSAARRACRRCAASSRIARAQGGDGCGPDGVRGRGCGHPGRCARRRSGPGRDRAGGRDPAHARSRDPGRRRHPADRAQHTDSVKRTESFTTAADMQTSVTIHVYQGERAMAADNISLGEFKGKDPYVRRIGCGASGS